MLAGKAFCLITGASKGFGRSVAAAFASQCSFKEGSKMVLMSRDEAGLQETKNMVQKANPNIIVHVVISDLGNMDSLESDISKALNVTEDFETAVLVNNAGTLADVTKKMQSHVSLDILRKYFDLNISSVSLLTAKFMNTFKTTKKIVLNISSLCAVQEMPYMSLYCTGKAARDMLFKCLACENEDTRVLNYSPGPMETAMSLDIQLNCGNEESRKLFAEMREKKTIIETDVSAAKMIRILKGNDYKSGAHVDFYDVE
eukprot:Seg2346.9 transcript_id=Seg2346.9/GoldUCD/mRNA.D3Y31 product="Sepiapterin reductase" protein_id=Seg2346.9/GoldUCD/D3Y31